MIHSLVGKFYVWDNVQHAGFSKISDYTLKSSKWESQKLKITTLIAIEFNRDPIYGLCLYLLFFIDYQKVA